MQQILLPEKNKLKWMCRRGLLELDILLNQIIDEKYDQLSDQQKYCFIEILGESDNDLLAWLVHQNPLPKQWSAVKKETVLKIR